MIVAHRRDYQSIVLEREREHLVFKTNANMNLSFEKEDDKERRRHGLRYGKGEKASKADKASRKRRRVGEEDRVTWSRKEGWKCECFATLPIRGCEASVSGLPPRGPVVHLGPSRPLGMKTSGPPPYVMTERTHSHLNSPCGSAC